MCAAFHACWESFCTAYPVEFVNTEGTAIRKALLGRKKTCKCATQKKEFRLRIKTLKSLRMVLSFRFLLRHADGDLQNLISESVPPCDLQSVGIFRGAIAKYEKKAQLTSPLVL